MVPDAAWPGSDQWPWSTAPAPGPVVRPRRPPCVQPMGCWFSPVPRSPYVCAVSQASWLVFTGVLAWFVVLCLRCPGPLGSCSPVRPLGVVCCVCGVPGPLAPVHRLGALCWVCGVLGHLAPVHRCACSVCCFACAVSWVTWLLFTGVPALSFVLFVRCPGPLNSLLGSCSPACPRGSLRCVCGVLGHLAPDHRCARSVCLVACAMSWAPWPTFTGVPARCVVLRVRCPGPLGSCSPVRPLGVLLCVRGVPGHLAPVHRCACSVFCFVCAVSWATWLLFTGVPARCAVLCVRCPGPLGSCSPVCQAVVSRPFVPLGARACAVSWPSWRLFTGVRAVCNVQARLCPSSSPPNFRFFLFFLKWKKGKNRGARTLQAQARAAGAAVQ